MKKTTFVAFTLLACCLFASSAKAGSPQYGEIVWPPQMYSATPPAKSWIFQPSYYSHDPVTHVRIGKASNGGPYFTRPQGAYVNFGFRNNRSTINVGGRTYDNVNAYESWVQTGEQF